jgi:hypothetical protein
MSAYMPLIKLTQRRKDAKVLRLFYYGRTTGHDMKGELSKKPRTYREVARKDYL